MSKLVKWKHPPAFSFGFYQELTKQKLSAFVVLTTMAGYAIAPGILDLGSLFYTTIGTGLCIASANSINQWIEVPFDSQMSRTRNRVLVRHHLSPANAFMAGLTSGLIGVSTLYAFVNPLTALLGGSNIILYTAIYTPLKRISIVNTWAGSLVGAIPPMMGWVAATNSLDMGAWLLGSALFAWQFPHFNSLAWNIRNDYAKAGYRMMSVTHPKLNSLVSLRYCLILFPISFAFPYYGITSWMFGLTSSAINGFMLLESFKFWRDSSDSNARRLFFSSLIHLPVYLGLLMFHKSTTETIEAKESKEYTETHNTSN